VPELTPPDGPRELPPTGEHTTGSLGRYKILGELGRGGCGIVYRALDPSIGRMVAIKTILAKTESSPGKESRERFRREARAAGNLSHPNIVTVHDFSDSGDPMFIAMEFVEGRTLAEAMSRGPLAVDFILGVLRSAADALDYAHVQHIVHRDIKPANFLINQSGRLKITDFGIAKMLDSDEGLTSTGMVVGTAQYMSPEQISETHVTGRSDQFSLAVIAYEMLAGVKPFQGNSWASVIHAIIMAEPPPITKYRNALGDGVNTVLRKALSKDPESRYATCTQFCEALEHELSGAVVERTLIFAKPQDGLAPAASVEQEKTRVVDGLPLGTKSDGGGPSTTKEVLPPLAKSPPAAKGPSRLVLIGAVGAVVIAAGAWLGLRSRNAHHGTPAAAEQPGSALQHSAPAVPPAFEPASPRETAATPVVRASGTTVKQTVKQAKEQTRVQGNAEPARPGKATALPGSQAAQPSAPVTSPNNPVPPTVESAPPAPVQPVPTVPRDLTPVPPPAPAPTKAQDDQAKRADDQAKRLAEEQARRAADDQAKRLSEEQAKNVRTAEYAAISRALRDYQAAYESKDLAALQTIWPSIPKQVLEGIRGSFRDASVVSMDLRALGDPKVSGGTATVVCDRNLRQVILNRALHASGRVRIVLNRAGSGWIIQSVDPVNQ
jgi:eukaryotic-like serine/threonine-protein kinase